MLQPFLPSAAVRIAAAAGQNQGNGQNGGDSNNGGTSGDEGDLDEGGPDQGDGDN